MAALTTTTANLGSQSRVTTWTLTTADHTGDALDLPGAADRTIQFDDTGGAWGTATVILEGSIDGTTFFALKDPTDAAITATADALFAVLQNCRFIRPRLSSVGSGATVKAYLLSKATG